MSGHNLAWDRITPEVYVSTGAIHYPSEAWGERWQIETCIFSKDPRQAAFTQRIHGSTSSEEYAQAGRMVDRARKIHGYIVANLRKRLTP